MITTVSALLKGFVDEERKKLDAFSLTHGPTIGKMYEGLASNVLNRSIPPSLNLQIVSGFIFDDNDVLTGQIDCMLVKGKGIQIPYTNDYKWHVKDVIVVLEIKKTLYAADLEDSFTHLREVSDRYSAYLSTTTSTSRVDTSFANYTFAQITGSIAPPWRQIREMPFDLWQIYLALITENLSPIRIVIGYHGFASEYSLRTALIDFLNKNLHVRGFGVIRFPQLIISGEYSLVKLNGMPYNSTKRSDLSWDFYASSHVNPILLMLEMIWTKLEREYHVGGFWGEDLQLESFAPLLSAKAVRVDDKVCWTYGITQFTEEELRTRPSTIEWEPTTLTSIQYTVMNQLCTGRHVSVNDHDFVDWLKNEGENPTEFVNSLLQTGFVALSGDTLQLVTEQCTCAILPDGQFVAAENNTGRLTRWLEKHLASEKPPD